MKTSATAFAYITNAADGKKFPLLRDIPVSSEAIVSMLSRLPADRTADFFRLARDYVATLDVLIGNQMLTDVFEHTDMRLKSTAFQTDMFLIAVNMLKNCDLDDVPESERKPVSGLLIRREIPELFIPMSQLSTTLKVLLNGDADPQRVMSFKRRLRGVRMDKDEKAALAESLERFFSLTDFMGTDEYVPVSPAPVMCDELIARVNLLPEEFRGVYAFLHNELLKLAESAGPDLAKKIAAYVSAFNDDLVKPTSMLAQLMYSGEARSYFEHMPRPRAEDLSSDACIRLAGLFAGNVALRPLRNALALIYHSASAARGCRFTYLNRHSRAVNGCNAAGWTFELFLKITDTELISVPNDEPDLRARGWWPMVRLYLDDREDVRRLTAMLRGSYIGIMRLPHDVRALTAFLKSGDEMSVEDFGSLYAGVRPFINFAETVAAENLEVELADVFMNAEAASRESFVEDTEGFAKRFAEALAKLPEDYFDRIKASVLEAADYAERILTLPPEIRFRLREGQGDVNLELFFEETAVMMLRKTAEALRNQSAED